MKDQPGRSDRPDRCQVGWTDIPNSCFCLKTGQNPNPDLMENSGSATRTLPYSSPFQDTHDPGMLNWEPPKTTGSKKKAASITRMLAALIHLDFC
jgi:hypothetical protein